MFELEIFKGIEPNVVERIISNAQVEYYRMGDIIFREGDNSNGKAYVIKSGEIEIIVNSKKIKNLKKGEIFGEIALLTEELRTATVKALTDLELIIITYSDLIDMVNNDDNIINKQIMRRIEENLKLIE